MTIKELNKFMEEWKSQMPTPQEFVRMVHDCRCPISEVGTYPWEKKETIADYANFVNFSDIPAHWQKKSWVPDWLWNLFAQKEFDV